MQAITATQTPTTLRILICAIARWIHLQILAINTWLMGPQNANKAEVSIDDSCTELADANGRLYVPFYGIHST
jgi:hypothetical protein